MVFHMSQESLSGEKYYLSNIIAFSLSWVLWSPITQATWVYFQLFLLELGASTVIVGYILSISTFIIGFARILGGYLADHYGRRKIIIILTYVASGTYLLYSIAPDWRYILLASIVMNIALLYQPAIQAIIADSLPKEHRGLGYAVINILPSFTAMFAPYIALYMVSKFGLVAGMRILYFLAFVMGTIVGTIRLFMLKETLHVKHRRIHNSDILKHLKLSYRHAFQFLIRNLKPLVALYILINTALGISILTQIYAVKYLGLTKEDWGWITFIGGITYFITSLPLGYLSDRIGRKKPISASIILSIISLYFYVTANLENAYMYILIASILGNLAWAISSSSFPALEADVIPHEFRGRLAALLALASSVAFGIGQLLSGYMYEIFSPRAPFMIALFVWGLSLIPLIWLREIKGK